MSERECVVNIPKSALTHISVDDHIKNDIELEYYEYYSKLFKKLFHSSFLIHHYEEMIERYSKPITNQKGNSIIFENMLENYESKLEEETHIASRCKLLLSKLEASTPIQKILNRARKPDEVIYLYYLNQELPTIPYAVYSSYREIYLFDEDIQLINNLTYDIKDSVSSPHHKNKLSLSNSLTIPLILSIILFISVFNMPYGFYIFARLFIFIFSIIFLILWYIANNKNFSIKFLPTIITAIVWNPIIPIHLKKEEWIILDICAIMLQILTSIFSCNNFNNKNK